PPCTPQPPRGLAGPDGEKAHPLLLTRPILRYSGARRPADRRCRALLPDIVGPCCGSHPVDHGWFEDCQNRLASRSAFSPTRPASIRLKRLARRGRSLQVSLRFPVRSAKRRARRMMREQEEIRLPAGKFPCVLKFH